MLKIGITGGIACGKSNITQLLLQKGYTVIDSDQITRELSEIGKPIYLALWNGFGESYFENGVLNRNKLGEFIFRHPEAREKINALTHPIVIEEIERRLSLSKEKIVFLDIPLLFEAHLEYLCDKIICVYVPYEVQLKRLIERDHISVELADIKIQSQLSLEIKKMKSDYCIHSDGTFAQTEVQLAELLKQIEGDQKLC